MSYTENPYQAPTFADVVARAEPNERSAFIVKTYVHLAGAVAAFVGLEAVLLNLPGIDRLVFSVLGAPFGWLIVLGLFMVVSHVANRWATSTTSKQTQYFGLALFVVAEAVIFVPLLYLAANYASPSVIPLAGFTTLFMFGALTVAVLVTRQDFSFLRSVLVFGGFAALALIACAILFNFELGVIFVVAMIALACGYILYDTSNVLHHYRTDQYVAASLALFASLALLFWYILRLFMSRD